MCFVIFTDWLVLRHSNVETIQSFQSQRLNSKNETRITWIMIFVNVLFTKDLFCNDRWRNTLMMYTSVSHADLTSISGVFVTSLRMPPHPWLGFVWLQTSPLTRVCLITTAADCWLSDNSQVALILIQCDYDQNIGVCLIMTNFDRFFQIGFLS